MFGPNKTVKYNSVKSKKGMWTARHARTNWMTQPAHCWIMELATQHYLILENDT